ncbi:hypothetical protein [Paenibacillus taichungensis]|uniref:hypothetical protein n=1 Tax=Paenibacillus taichungensis TaxID=484184 RepID=UPI0035DAE214
MKNQLRSAIANFQSRRKIYLFTFIVNCVLFGIISAISAGLTFPELAESYPMGTTFVWSMLLATFLMFGLRQMFYWNLVPLLLNIGYALMNAGYEVEESETHLVEGGFQLEAVTALIIVAAFFVVGIVMQLISSLTERKKAKQENPSNYNEVRESDDEDEDDFEDDYDERQYQPIGNDNSHWR